MSLDTFSWTLGHGRRGGRGGVRIPDTDNIATGSLATGTRGYIGGDYVIRYRDPPQRLAAGRDSQSLVKSLESVVISGLSPECEMSHHPGPL